VASSGDGSFRLEFGERAVGGDMTAGDWVGLSLQVVATVAAAVAAIAAWRSIVGVSNERKAEARWRADEHLKTIHALIIEWFQAFSPGPGARLRTPHGLAARTAGHDGTRGTGAEVPRIGEY
jgi:hypothetical protein